MKQAGRVAVVLAAILAAGAQWLPAQSSVAEQLRLQWTASRRQIVAIAEAMPESKFQFKATPEVRSFGEIVAHIPGQGMTWMETVAGVAQPEAAERYDALQDRADILKVLSEYFDYGSKALAAMTDQQALEVVPFGRRQVPRWVIVMQAIGHNKEHYGNLVTYMRLTGIVPPSTAAAAP